MPENTLEGSIFHVHTHTHTRKKRQALTHKNTHAHTHTHAQNCMHARTRAFAHTHTHTHTHKHTQNCTQAHTHTHTHAQANTKLHVPAHKEKTPATHNTQETDLNIAQHKLQLYCNTSHVSGFITFLQGENPGTSLAPHLPATSPNQKLCVAFTNSNFQTLGHSPT